MYSKRKGTIAEKMDNQVPIATKRERIHRVLAIEHDISTNNFNKMIGSTQRVLIESENNINYIAKAQCGKVVKLNKIENKVSVGQFVDCKIIDYKNGNLLGRVE